MQSEHHHRLAALRAALAKRGLDGFLIPRADEHLGEYVPASAERLAFITGFTGSAGLAIVLADRAAVWSDGRYTLQLEQQTDGTLWERLHLIEQKPEEWLKADAAGRRIGYDPMLISADGLKRFAGAEMVPVERNPLDEIWADRPAPPMGPAVPQPDLYAGESSAAKRTRLAAALREAQQDAAILSDPASLAWLFNIRGTDVEFTPIALGYALLFADGTAGCSWPARNCLPRPAPISGTGVELAERDALPASLQALAGKTVRYDPATQPVWFKTTLKRSRRHHQRGGGPGGAAARDQKPRGAKRRPRRACARRRGDGALPRLGGGSLAHGRRDRNLRRRPAARGAG